MMTAKDIARQLAQRAEEIACYLLPNGKKDGSEWRVGNVHGDQGKSLGVHLTGAKAGVWCDFSAGGSGDLLDLWALKRSLTIPEAMKEVMGYLGITLPQFAPQRSPKFVKPSLKDVSAVKSGSPVHNYLLIERKLNERTIHAYKLLERQRAIVFPYIRDGETVFSKSLSLDRIDGKKHMSVEANCEPCLFGWHLIPDDARTIIICEGEIDAMTLYQYGLPALSVPFGGGGKDKQKWVEHEFDRLTIYDDIYLCFDNDNVGYAAVTELIARLGQHRCRIVKLPCHDANECLQEGIARSVMHQCFTDAKTLDPSELKSAALFAKEVIDEFYPAEGMHLGYEPPWGKAKGKILFRPDELSVWTGINGHGKSQFVGQVILHAMSQGARVCIASLELKPQRLLTRLARQAGAIIKPSIEYIQAIHQWYDDKLWIFDLVGTAKSKRLLDVFLYARQRYNIDVFVIDSLMKLDIAEDDYKAQKALMEQLCDFKNQHACHIHIIVHPRKSADESQPPGKLDNKGTGAISDLADNCFAVWRNKAKEKLLQCQTSGIELNSKELGYLKAADCKWCCDKQRNGDWEGQLGFWFHPASLQYLPSTDHKPVRLVEYSNQHRS